jgi:hypothetical protein
MKLSYGLILIFLTPLLAACEQLGFEDPAAEKAREEAEGKAIGSGCRQTGRALEDCYQINRRAPKAAIFAGWRDMDGYMRENKIEEIKPDFPMKPPPGKGRPLESAEGAEESAQQKPAANGEAATAKPAQEAKPAETAPGKKPRPPLAR